MADLRRLTAEEFEELKKNAARDIADGVITEGLKSIEHRLWSWMVTMLNVMAEPAPPKKDNDR